MADEETPTYEFIEAGRVASSATYLSFAEGKRDGKVRVKYPNGDLYLGTYKQIGASIRREGHGVYTWNLEDADDGEGGAPIMARYEGQYARGLRHGIGMMKYSNGDVYRGRFVLNKREGQGTLTVASSGDMYSGSWVSDKREGFGAYVFAKNGDQLVGEWRESNPTAWCQWLLGDGTVMQLDAASAATFKGAAPLGAASFTFISGLQQTGVFTAEDPDADGDSLALSWASKTTSAAPVAGAALVAQPDVPKASVAQRLLILSAPVGIGQDAAVDAMLAAYPDAFTVIAQHTSAADSGSARFTSVSADEMASLKEAGKFAESHEYDGAQVGTSVEAIDAARSSGKIGLISTDLNGCRTLKQAGFDALYAYIAPSEAKLAELFAPAPGASKEGEEEEDEAAAEAAAAAAEAMQAKLELASEELAAASEQAEVAGDEVPLFTEILASDDAAVVLEDLLDAVRVHIAPL